MRRWVLWGVIILSLPAWAGDETEINSRWCGPDVERIGEWVLIEGDIAVGRCLQMSEDLVFEARGAFASWVTSSEGNAATVPQDWTWPEGVVPYVLAGAFASPENAEIRDSILSAIRHWNTGSVVHLIPRTDEEDYVEFIPSTGCWSWVGYVGGRQEIGLGDCSFGTIVHEIGHTLGFYHEQSRDDRDLHIEVIWDKIEPARRHNFEIYDRGRDRGPYDYGSVMHYSATAFSIDNSPTLVPDPFAYEAWASIYGDVPIGQRSGTSPLDREAVNGLYESCSDREPESGPFWSAGLWRDCSSSCTAPGRHRQTFCHDSAGSCADDMACAGLRRPVVVESCVTELDCDFENGTCGWDGFDVGDTFDWVSYRGRTPSSGTGPEGDHTTGSGFYIYAEASSPREQGDSAFLTSVPFNIPHGSVLTFWYHLAGEAPGTLQVELASCVGESQVLFEIQGTPSQREWLQASVPLPHAFDSRIRFKAIRGPSFSGDIAIDDIEISGVGPIFQDGFEDGELTPWSLGEF